MFSHPWWGTPRGKRERKRFLFYGGLGLFLTPLFLLALFWKEGPLDPFPLGVAGLLLLMLLMFMVTQAGIEQLRFDVQEAA